MINKECPIIMDKICRSCMNEGDEMRSVFESKEQEAGQSVQLATMLMACASVMVENDDGLPPLLCITCEQQLSNAYQFKQQCEKTDSTLREYSSGTTSRIKQEAESMDIIVKPDIHGEILDSMYGGDDFDSSDSDRNVKKRSKTKGLSCKYCSKVFSKKHTLEIHQKKHKGEKLCCYICQEAFSKTNHLLCHVKTHKGIHQEQKHKCMLCGMGFSKAYHLLKHKKEHKLNKKVKQEVLEKENGDEGDEAVDLDTGADVMLEQDSTDSEAEDPSFTFPGADKSDSAAFPCDYCGKVLTTYMGLQIHMRRHTGSNLATCKICDKSFTKNSHLKRHMLTHSAAEKAPLKEKSPESKEKKYLECEFCDRKFVYKKSFQHHIQSEHGVSDDSDTPLSNYTKKDVIKIEVEPTIPGSEMHAKSESFSPDDLAGALGVASSSPGHGGDDDSDDHFLEVEGTILDDANAPTSEKKLIHACHVCEAKFARPNHLTRHMTLHRSILVHKCDRCEKAFATPEHLAKHVQEYHVDRPYVCSICERPFSRGEHLIRHLKIHNKDNNPKEEHKCSICDKIFSRSDHLARHTKLHLQQDKRHVCGECGKAFNRLDNLRTHQRVHSGMRDQQRLHLCIYCGKEFNNSSNMIVHMRRHTGERPYKCGQCGKGFPRSHDLKCHERTHSGEKPYLCTLCGKSFNKSNKLLRHSRVHTGERPYVCNLCGRAFTQSNDLALHMRRHTGSRPYACGMCPARFIQSGQLKAHRRSQGHWVETPPDLKGGHRVSPVTPIANPVPIKFKTRVNKIGQPGTGGTPIRTFGPPLGTAGAVGPTGIVTGSGGLPTSQTAGVAGMDNRILGHTIGIMGGMDGSTPIMVDGAKILEQFQNAAALATFAAGHSVISHSHHDALKLTAAEVVHAYNTQASSNQGGGGGGGGGATGDPSSGPSQGASSFSNPSTAGSTVSSATEDNNRRLRDGGTPTDLGGGRQGGGGGTFQGDGGGEGGSAQHIIYSSAAVSMTNTPNTFTSSDSYSYQNYG